MEDFVKERELLIKALKQTDLELRQVEEETKDLRNEISELQRVEEQCIFVCETEPLNAEAEDNVFQNNLNQRKQLEEEIRQTEDELYQLAVSIDEQMDHYNDVVLPDISAFLDNLNLHNEASDFGQEFIQLESKWVDLEQQFEAEACEQEQVTKDLENKEELDLDAAVYFLQC